MRTFSVDMRTSESASTSTEPVHVALDDQGQVLDAGLPDLFRQSFERNARALGELRFALLHLAVLRDALGLVAVGDDQERVAGVGHGFETEHFDRGRRPGFFDRPSAIVKHGADLAEGVADDVAVVELQCAVLDQHGSHRAAAAIELGFQHRADALRPGVALGALMSETRQIISSSRSRFWRFFAETSTKTVPASPAAHSSGTSPRSANCFLTRSGFAPGLSILFTATMIGTFGGLGVVDGFQRLRHHAVIRRHHDDDNIRHLGAARTHAGERLVARGIEEHDLAARRRRAFLGEAHLVGADVLRDSAGFARRHVRFADRVEQRGLAVVDVAHDRDHRCARHLDHLRLVRFEHLFDGLVFQLLFVADDVGRGAELGRNVLHHLRVERLVDRDEDAPHEQRRDQVLGANFELLGQVLDADALGHRDLAGDGQGLMAEVGRPAETPRRDKALHRAFLGLGILLASAPAAPGRRAARRPRRFAR